MLFKKKKEKSPKELLREIESLREEVSFLSSKVEKLTKEKKSFIQQVGIVRYNPFSEIGGNQSFSLAVLDEKKDGFVITSIYAREGNRVYAKPIKNNSSDHTLSEEEGKAIKLCQKK